MDEEFNFKPSNRKSPYRFRATRRFYEFETTKDFFEHFREMRDKSEDSFQFSMKRDRPINTYRGQLKEADRYTEIAREHSAFGFQYQSINIVTFFFEREEDQILMRIRYS